MSNELPKPTDVFGLADSIEQGIPHERFATILIDERTVVHHMEVSSNDSGEFLFVTMSQEGRGERIFVTFWGLGFDTQQDHWLTDEWRWGKTQQLLHQIPQKIAPEDALAWIQERRDEIAPSSSPSLKK